MSFLRFTIPASVAVALFATGCSFQLGTKKPNSAANNGTPTTEPAPTTPTTTTPSTGTSAKPSLVVKPRGTKTLSKASLDVLKRRKSSGGTTPPATTTDPRFVTAATPFGGPDGNDTSYVGLIYFTNPGATALPAFESLQPTGAMFVNTLNVAPNTTFSGFPGVDNRANDFAIRYEAPLIVTTEAEYTLRLVSDDGAKLYIDDMLILDNDGVKTAAGEKSGPVRLSAETHSIKIDYFHTTGPVALQVYVKGSGTAETLLGTKL